MQSFQARTLTVAVTILGVLALSQILWAAKQAVSKDTQARVVYSGQFKGQVEPCG